MDFKGYVPDDGAEFLRHLINECADADIPIKEIRVDPAYVQPLTRGKTESGLEQANQLLYRGGFTT